MTRRRRHLAFGTTMVLLLAAGGCGGADRATGEQQDTGGTGGDGDGDTGSGTGGSGHACFTDDWRVEVDAEFPYIVGGQVNISSIGIGGLLSQDNFANRGDVIVKLDGPEDRITVEMQRFTQGEDEADAAADFEAMELLAYTGSLRPPDEIPEESRCGGVGPDTGELLPWRDGCAIRLYYRGQIQPSRLGAHLRVTLPSSYRHSIFITTSDHDGSPQCHHPGNVCVESLNGSADIELESGAAHVILDRETTPGPTCSAADIEACETWTQDGEPAAWSSECPCMTFGSASVEASGPANLSFDAPQQLWASFSLANDGADPSPDGDHCTAEVDWDAAVVQPQEVPWVARGEANHPSVAAVAGGGFSIRGAVGGCATGEEGETRGNLLLCAGCLDGRTCEDLLSDG